MITADGVKKGQTYMGNLSNVRSSPKFTIAARDKNPAFLRSNSTPAPGTYDSLDDRNNPRYAHPPKVSFGVGDRFVYKQDRQPGPGAYTPKDPARSVSRKVGFGASTKIRSAPTPTENPGPGAYEMRSCLGEGPMFSSYGRLVSQQLSSKSFPGPGTYNPSTWMTAAASPKTGFGTSRRTPPSGPVALSPGPGSYNMQNTKGLGQDAPMITVVSRRKLHDISSYLTPGPGAYNAHSTCFGGP